MLLELRHRLPQEDAGRVDVEFRLGRLRAVEPDPVLRKQRLELGKLPDEVLARIARAKEREDVLAALPHERRRKAERGVVLRL